MKSDLQILQVALHDLDKSDPPLKVGFADIMGGTEQENRSACFFGNRLRQLGLDQLFAEEVTEILAAHLLDQSRHCRRRRLRFGIDRGRGMILQAVAGSEIA